MEKLPNKKGAGKEGDGNGKGRNWKGEHGKGVRKLRVDRKGKGGNGSG